MIDDFTPWKIFPFVGTFLEPVDVYVDGLSSSRAASVSSNAAGKFFREIFIQWRNNGNFAFKKAFGELF